MGRSWFRTGARRMAQASLAALVYGAAGCGESATRPDASTLPARSTGEPATASSRPPAPTVTFAQRCDAQTPVSIGQAPLGLELDLPACGLGLAFGPRGALAAFPTGPRELAVVPLDAALRARGAATTVAIEAARGLLGIQALGEQFLLVTLERGDCAPPEAGVKAQCLHALLVGDDGHAVGASQTTSLGAHGIVSRTLLGDGRRAVLSGHRNLGGPFALEWRSAGDLLDVRDLGAQLPGRPDEYHEAVAPAAGFAGERWFVVTSRDTARGATSALYAVPAWPSAPANGDGGELPIVGLPTAFGVDRAALEDDALWLVGRVHLGPPEGDLPPELVRVDQTGHVIERGSLAQATLPAVWAGETHLGLRRAGGELLATASDLRGLSVALPVALGHDAAPPAAPLAWVVARAPASGSQAVLFASLGAGHGRHEATEIHAALLTCTPTGAASSPRGAPSRRAP